ELAAVGGADPGPEDRARARDDPPAGRPAEPRGAAAGVPVPYAVPVRAADALPGGAAAAAAAAAWPRGRVPLGRADPERRHHAARAGADLRARPRRGGTRAAADLADVQRKLGTSRRSRARSAGR